MFNTLSTKEKSWVFNVLIISIGISIMISLRYGIWDALKFNSLIVFSSLPIGCTYMRTRDFENMDLVLVTYNLSLINIIQISYLFVHYSSKLYCVLIIIAISACAILRVIFYNIVYKDSLVKSEYSRLVAALTYGDIVSMIPIIIISLITFGFLRGILCILFVNLVLRIFNTLITRLINLR